MYLYPNHRLNSLSLRNYIAGNLQNSQVEVYFCALRNTPVDLAKVYYLGSFPIQKQLRCYSNIFTPNEICIR